MSNRIVVLIAGLAAVVALGISVYYADGNTENASNSSNENVMENSVKKNGNEDDHWREKLTPLQYRVTRQHGTERAFTGEYWDHQEDGIYTCVCCGQPLFDSQTKFKSGTGWPSFFDIINSDQIKRAADDSLAYELRTEVICSNCDAHLGHVFPDGPAPTGLRYCVNSAALNFKKRNEE